MGGSENKQGSVIYFQHESRFNIIIHTIIIADKKPTKFSLYLKWIFEFIFRFQL